MNKFLVAIVGAATIGTAQAQNLNKDALHSEATDQCPWAGFTLEEKVTACAADPILNPFRHSSSSYGMARNSLMLEGCMKNIREKCPSR